MKTALQVLVLLLATASAAGATVRTVNIADLPGGDFAFQPQIVFVTLGDTVRWLNQSAATHTSTSGITPVPDGLWTSAFLGTGGSFSRAFNSMGSFRYFCNVHPGMTGMVRVTRAVVTIQGFAFHPATIGVGLGDTVTWINKDAFTHTSTSGAPAGIPDGLWNSGNLGNGGSHTVRMASAGSHPYYCNIHNTMTGTVSVGAATGVEAGPAGAARLLAARPNPARHQVQLGFELAQAGPARLTLFNASGSRVATLAAGTLGPGRHDCTWNGRASNGRPAPTGVYYYRLEAGEYTSTRRFTWLR